jgi:hypothetical protein
MNFDPLLLPPVIDYPYPRPKQNGGLDLSLEVTYGPVTVAKHKNATMGMLMLPGSSNNGAVLSSVETLASANPELLAGTQDL